MKFVDSHYAIAMNTSAFVAVEEKYGGGSFAKSICLVHLYKFTFDTRLKATFANPTLASTSNISQSPEGF